MTMQGGLAAHLPETQLRKAIEKERVIFIRVDGIGYYFRLLGFDSLGLFGYRLERSGPNDLRIGGLPIMFPWREIKHIEFTTEEMPKEEPK